MKAEQINPFISSVIKVFRTMCHSELERGKPMLKSATQPGYDVSGVIGLTGRTRGIVVLSLDRAASLRVTELMLGDRPQDINADVTDAVGELTNMIAGNAKAKLDELELSISLPTVIVGKWHCIQFPQGATAIAVPFSWEYGEVALEVGLVEESVCTRAEPALAGAWKNA